MRERLVRISHAMRVFLLLHSFFFFQAEDGIRDVAVTGVQTCALPISRAHTTLQRAQARMRRARTRRASEEATPTTHATMRWPARPTPARTSPSPAAAPDRKSVV